MPKTGAPSRRPATPTPDRKKSREFVHSVLSFTRLEIPSLELFETAVTFPPATDPFSAHDALAATFGQKAGEGMFLFRADSATPGRYWTQSVEPWTAWPRQAVSALEPKRIVVQLAEGLMYRFTLPVCVGRETYSGKEKLLEPFKTPQEVESWFNSNARAFGIKPLMVNVSLQVMRFEHRGQKVKIPHAVIEGALEVSQAELLKRRIVRGFGSFRRAGLGMLQISA
jgi:CRISPR-associated protein Cas6/Cse3/CasE subtype I-E